MTKAYSKAAKRARKRNRCGVELLGKRFAKMAEIQGMLDAPADDKPLETVMGARARLLGIKPEDSLLSPMLCEEAGRAIDLGAKDKQEARKLWATFIAMDASHNRYFLRIVGRQRFPAVSKMEYMPERLETRADDVADTRTPEQKDTDAASSWKRWRDTLAYLAAHERASVRRAMWQMDKLHSGADLTTAGKQFVAALRTLHGVVERSS